MSVSQLKPSGEVIARLRAVDSRVLWVPTRIMRRIVKASCGISGFGIKVPHQSCYPMRADSFWGLVDVVELEQERKSAHPFDREAIDDDATSDGSGWVLPISHPDLDGLNRQPMSEVLMWGWKVLLHARIDLAFADLLKHRKLTPAAILGRIQRIGQTEFHEIRAVLRQEERLLPPVTNVSVYTEFAALYAELCCFEPQSKHAVKNWECFVS